MISILAFVLILAPILVYLVSALLERKRVLASSDFFLAAGQVSSFEFANSSIGYGFQIASVSVFLAWGYLYGFAALVNPFFWGIGIALFAVLLPKMVSYLGSGKTLHGYLGERYASRSLEIIASLATLVGFLGTFVAELAWGSAVFRLFSPSPVAVGAILTGMAIVITIYLVRAGQLNAMRTDQLQLVFTYVGFLGLAVTLAWLAANGGMIDRAAAFILSGVLALCLVVMATMMWRQISLERVTVVNELFTLTKFVRPILVVLVAMALVGLLVNMIRSPTSPASLRVAISQPQFFTLSQGTLNLLSLALLPLLWQFVDVTMWQRLASVQLSDEDGATAPTREKLRPIRVGLQRFAFESPITWLFAIVIGMLLRHVDIGVTEQGIWDALGAIPLALREASGELGQPLGLMLAIGFGAAIVAAMLSTADSMLMGALAVFSLDLASPVQRTAGTPESLALSTPDIRVGRAAIVVFVTIALGVIWLQLMTSIQILPILLGAYAAQISLAVSVVGALVLPRELRSRGWAIASILAGVAATAYATAVALGNAEWQLFAPLFALGASIPVYLTGILVCQLSRGRKEAK